MLIIILLMWQSKTSKRVDVLEREVRDLTYLDKKNP
jgi:hypothetical protein